MRALAAGALLLCAAGVRADSVVWTVSDIAGFGQALAVQPDGQRIYYGCPGYDRHTTADNQGVVAVGTPGGGFSGLIEYPHAPAFGSLFGGEITASDSHVAIWGASRVFVYNAGGGSHIAEYGGAGGFGADIDSTSSTLYVGWPNYNGNQGRVYCYPWGPTTSPLIIEHPEPTPNDHFGEDMAIGNSLIAISTARRSGNVGKVYLFDLATHGFIQAIDNPTTVANRFGSRLAFAGDNLVVWAGGDALAIPPTPSTAYLFDAGTGSLIAELQKFLSSDFKSGALAANHAYILCGNENLAGQTGGSEAGGYRIYDAVTGQYLWTTINPTVPGTGNRWGFRGEFIGPDVLVNDREPGGNKVARMQLVPPLAGVEDWGWFK